MSNAVIVAATRTAIGKFGGALAKTPAPELAHRVARTCLELGMMTSVVRGGFGIFRIAPPITIAKDEIDLALGIFDAAIRKSLS